MTNAQQRAARPGLALAYLITAVLTCSVVVGIVLINSQGSGSWKETALALATSLTGPVPMLFVGWALYRGRAWGRYMPAVPPLISVIGLIIARSARTPLGEVSGFELLCRSLAIVQSFYLPAAVVLALIALIHAQPHRKEPAA